MLTIAGFVTIAGELREDGCVTLRSPGILQLQSSVSGSCASMKVTAGTTLVSSPLQPSTVAPAVDIAHRGIWVVNGSCPLVLWGPVHNSGVLQISGTGDVVFSTTV